MTPAQAIPPYVRLMRHVTINADGCWIFTGALNSYGYCQISIGSRTDGSRRRIMGHRLTYQHHKGPIPDGMALDHFRLNPGPRQAPCSHACVNPDHVEPTTYTENTLRGVNPVARLARRDRCPKCGGPFEPDKFAKRRCRPCLRAYHLAWDRAHYATRAPKVNARRRAQAALIRAVRGEAK